MNAETQYNLLNEYSKFYPELPFPETPSGAFRYYYQNDWFSYSDGIFLYSFLRKFKPKRIVEVGSGFSSAVILDTIENFFPKRPKVTFIEPYPDRLRSLLKDSDTKHVNLLVEKLQDAPSAIFAEMRENDLLFIDSSHVLKCGSDLQWLLFEILPHINAGVVVHFHDVFYPFVYPDSWLNEGIYWNESYFLRAFLSGNADWEILFFNTFVSVMFNDIIKVKMPLCAKNPGGSLYIKRVKKDY